MGMGRDKRKAYKARKLIAASKVVEIHKPYEPANINNLSCVGNHDKDVFSDADWRAVARMMIRLRRMA